MGGQAPLCSKGIHGQMLVSRITKLNFAHIVFADDVLRHYPDQQGQQIKAYWSGITGDIEYNHRMVLAAPNLLKPMVRDSHFTIIF